MLTILIFSRAIQIVFLLGAAWFSLKMVRNKVVQTRPWLFFVFSFGATAVLVITSLFTITAETAANAVLWRVVLNGIIVLSNTFAVIEISKMVENKFGPLHDREHK